MVKRLHNLKTCLKNQQGEFERTKIVLIRVHLETGRWLTVVHVSLQWCFSKVYGVVSILPVNDLLFVINLF